MELKHLLVFLVICQCYRESELRPANISDGFKLIQSFTTEMNITLNGTMKVDAKLLFLSLSDMNSNHVCSMTYNVTAKEAIMRSELGGENSLPYEIEHDSTVPSKFWLRIEPRKSGSYSYRLINLHFEVDSAGPLIFDDCKLNDFENIHRIVVEGAQSISSLLFEFSE